MNDYYNINDFYTNLDITGFDTKSNTSSCFVF